MEVDFFYVHILRIKTMIGQNKLTVKLNITPFEYIKFALIDLRRFRANVSSQIWRGW